MKNYVIINHNNGTGSPVTPQEWGAFFGAISSNLVDGGKPFTRAKAALKEGETISTAADDVVAYYIIKADSLDDAIALTKASPLADKPGCEVRVYETMQM